MKSFQGSSRGAAGGKEFEKAGKEISSLVSAFIPRRSAVEINLVGEKKMAWLNRTFKGRKGSAEVLTFRYPFDPASSDEDGTTAGEIYICWKKLAEGAARRRVSTRAYLLRLVVHGMCHIEGYTHGDEKSEARMEKAEMAYLGPFIPSRTMKKLFD
jgi:rRNA maturation RNase YbeY